MIASSLTTPVRDMKRTLTQSLSLVLLLAGPALASGSDKLVVEVSCANQRGARFTLGRDAEGRAICLEDGLAAVIDPRVEAYDLDLIESLGALFGE